MGCLPVTPSCVCNNLRDSDPKFIELDKLMSCPNPGLSGFVCDGDPVEICAFIQSTGMYSNLPCTPR